jgi:hypothetical protein
VQGPGAQVPHRPERLGEVRPQPQQFLDAVNSERLQRGHDVHRYILLHVQAG